MRKVQTMTTPRILVTAATGKTGAAVVAELLKAGQPVRALVRRQDARSEGLRAAGAEIATADMFDVAGLTAALDGIESAYFVPVFHPRMPQAATAFAVAARATGLGTVVQLSQWLASPDHPSLMTRQIRLVERQFETLPGTNHVIVNPGMFADNFLRVMDFAALLGIFPVLTGDSRSAPVSNEDIARTVAAILTDPAPHSGRRYRPTGPALLSGEDMARIAARVVGHRVMPVRMPFWMFLKVARMQGVEPFELSGFRHYMADHARGAFSFDGGVSDVVRDLTGAPAEPFEATARRYAAMPFAEVSTGRRLRAIADLLRVPLMPGYNLDRYDRQQGFPVPPHARLAMDDSDWQSEREAQGRLAVARPRLAAVAT